SVCANRRAGQPDRIPFPKPHWAGYDFHRHAFRERGASGEIPSRAALRWRLAIEAKEKALAAAAAAQDTKGHGITIIDLESECSYTDFLVIISANSERQTAGIAEAVTKKLREDHGLRPLFRE